MKRKIKFFWNEREVKPAPFHYKNKASFYASPPWRNLRAYKLTVSPLCERCSRDNRPVAAVEVHHIKQISEAPDLALEITNLESLCKICHSQESYKNLSRARKPPKGNIITFKSIFIDEKPGEKQSGDRGSEDLTPREVR